MIGPALNAAGILIGGVLGWISRKPLGRATESYFRVVLGALTVYYGLRLSWLSLSGSFGAILRQLAILILALAVGRILGRVLRMQKYSNRLGQAARERISSVKPADPGAFSQGFKTCSALFCAAPLAIVGAVPEGLSMSEYFYPLAIKAVMDGLASIGFVRLFGPGVLLSAVPVFALEGTISLIAAKLLQPILSLHHLVDSVNAVAGLLVFCVALVMLGLKRIELADYLPSLVVAPLLTLWLR